MLGRLSPIRLVVLSCVFSLVLAEVVLRLLGTQRTFAEVSGHNYQLYFDKNWETHYRKHDASTVQHHTNLDFAYNIVVNKHGFVGAAPAERKTRFRIAVLGDSFTEGVGALSPDSSYPALLENLLASEYPNLNAEVLNFGVGGSDVVFETRYLIDSMAQFAPDLVIMTYNNSDLTDIVQMGGEERFHLNGLTYSRSAPWWTSIYQYSHLFRLWITNVLDYDSELYFKKTSVKGEFAHAEEVLLQSVLKANEHCKKIGCKFLFVLMPFAQELVSSRQETETFFKNMTSSLQKTEVACINLYSPMSAVINEQTLKQYSWWKYDGHYRHTGYLLVAQSVANSPELKAVLNAQ